MTETVTFCGPGAGGAITRISVSETTVKLAADIDPNRTPPAPVNPEPVSVTTVPPRRGPDDGSTVETWAGAGAAAIAAEPGCPPALPAEPAAAPCAPEGAAPFLAHRPQSHVVVVVLCLVVGEMDGVAPAAGTGAAIVVGAMSTGGAPGAGT